MPEPEINYSEASIQVLDGLEAVRKRPAMYIGSTSSRGLHHLIWEIIDNSIDEAMAGNCDRISVRFKKDGSCQIVDNGPGIPVGMHPVLGIPTLELIMTRLHSGGKFSNAVYKVSGGLHGVGLAVVNALSKVTIIDVLREGKKHRQRFMKGETAGPIQIVGDSAGQTGTSISFLPDDEIFTVTEFDFGLVVGRLKELSFLNKGLTIEVYDERSDEEHIFYQEDGISGMVLDLNGDRTIISEEVIAFEKLMDNVVVEVALLYNSGFDKFNIHSFANNIRTHEGGTHLSGFKGGLTRSLNNYAKKKGMFKDDSIALKGEDVREGLIAIISVKVPEPQFEGQTKTRLGNSEVQGITGTAVYDGLTFYLENHPSEGKAIVDKCMAAYQDREKLLKQRRALQEARSHGSLPGKLADCSSKDPKKREIFVVEGNSAGGNAKQGRYREYQAILPLRGKVINAEKANLLKLLKNKEIMSILKALGLGVEDNEDLSTLRYDKVIIMCDADVDGRHIVTLLLTFFFRYLRTVISQGHLYIAQPPLFKIKKGKKAKYAWSKDEMRTILKAFNMKEEGEGIQRFKGLGEMNASELRETTMDPAKRKLAQVTIKDAVNAERIFSVLMGENVPARREFIMSRADSIPVEDLDI